LLLHPEEDGLGVGIEGVRGALQEVPAEAGEDAGFLRALRDEPAEQAHWNAYSDWLHERGLAPAGLHLLERALRRAGPTQGRKNRDPARDLLRVTPHLAQAAKHEGRWPDDDFLWFTPHDTYERLLLERRGVLLGEGAPSPAPARRSEVHAEPPVLSVPGHPVPRAPLSGPAPWLTMTWVLQSIPSRGGT
jgi:uncharacterized protein (TIGR02996 family)